MQVEPAPHTTPAHAASTQAPATQTAPGAQVIAPHEVGRHSPAAQRVPAAQTRPHAPQSSSSSLSSEQPDSQRLWPTGHEQAPAVQLAPAGQASPTQSRSTQPPLEQTWPAGQAPASAQAVSRQSPFAQRVPGLQARPHVPQFVSEVSRLTQVPLQRASEPAQTQAPPTQRSPAGQTTPTHDRSTHSFWKQMESGSHCLPWQSSEKQAPLAHDSLAGHALPQPPQFASSRPVSTQAPPQVSRPGPPQTQAPFEQTSGEGHTTPTHDLSTQRSSKHTESGSQTSPAHWRGKQAEFAQVLSAPHSVPQAPQLWSSCVRVEQPEAQARSSGLHSSFAGGVPQVQP
jgi:hypothetical protein